MNDPITTRRAFQPKIRKSTSHTALSLLLPLKLSVAVMLGLWGMSLGTTPAKAQTYSIDWYKIAGGGGTSTGSVYSISGTVGQHDAGGPMVNGSYSLMGGFWALLSVVQTPGAPTLYMSRSNSVVTVYWQNVAGWNLQQNPDLTASGTWSPSAGVTTSNGTNYLNLTSPPGNLFFRLHHQ